jgi:PepSY-associated transmembrane protein
MKRLLSFWIFDWRKLLAYTHRWMGIAGCVLFVAWFVSGVVMMYARMPGLANEERLARAPALDLSGIRLSPAEAAEGLGVDVDRVEVGMLQGRPVYRFGGREPTIVFADSGDFFEGINRNEAEEIARRYAPGHTLALRHAAVLTAIDPDQWTIQARARMPMHRFDLDDPDDTHLYVSEVTGDVELRTTRAERFWGYLGPVFHWVYFTPLRKNGPVWTQFVIWSSLIGCVMCITGIVWGLWRYSPRKRFRLKRVPTVSPYAGWMKWHHIAGLIFGVVTLTWTYSGLLSMGPFNWFRSASAGRAEREASTGGPLKVELLTIESMKAAVAAIEPSFAPKELESTQFRGEPFWMARRAPTEEEAVLWMHEGLLPRAPRPRLEHRYVSVVHPERGAVTSFGRDAMTEIAKAAMPGVPMQDAVWLQEYDGYYYDPRASRPLPVLRVRYEDENATWLYLDPERGGIVQRSTSVSRLRRWLYQGFHSLDFPFLYFYRPLWDIVVIVLSIGGTVLSFTTMLPAWRRLKRHGRALAAWRPRRFAASVALAERGERC